MARQYKSIQDVTLLVDGLIFQLHHGKLGGISNVWRTLLDSIGSDNRFKKVLLLDRGGLPEHLPFQRIPFGKFSDDKFHDDSEQIEKICGEHGVDLFISTYFTSPLKFYSIAFLHDFIPEKVGMNINHQPWISKIRTMDRAGGFIGVSATTLDDLKVMLPKYNSRPRSLVYNSISDEFGVYPEAQVEATKLKYGIQKKYFVLLGQRVAYKNCVVFFKAFSELKNKHEFQIICVGGYKELEYLFDFYIRPFKDVLTLSVGNQELSQLLNQAEALVYPSLYEGFGMPILEGMASGCPLIIAKQASACHEVAGESALVVDGHDVQEMVRALEIVQTPEVRKSLIDKGRENAARFTRDLTLHQFYAAIEANLPSMSAFYEALQ